MYLFYLSLLHLTLSQELNFPYILSDCTHLILPPRCQCYFSSNEPQLHCHNIQLDFIPRLPNNMHWYALDFSANNLTSLDSFVFSEINVEKLNLQSNYLETIEITAFDRIQNLRQLFIDHNQLKEFHPHILTSPGVSLEILDISNNPFEYLNLGEMFLELPVLKEFYAVLCQLTNSSLYTLLKLSEHEHHYLRILDLSYNNLTSLCNNFFNNFLTLIELRLNNNNIYLIDNYFISSLNYLQILNLAFNSIEYVPNLVSSSLQNFNLSSNNIRYLNDYFASNLYSIRVIDFDSNRYLNSVSLRSFCFINILTLQKLSFRFNNIMSLDAFSQLLCQLLDNSNNINGSIIDLNNNVNVECSCILTQFEKYLINYLDLTCTQQGQNRYFISQITNLFSNCTLDFCTKQRMENLCEWDYSKRVVLEGACETILIDNENSTKNESKLIKPIIDLNLWKNVSENSTEFYEKRQTSSAILIKRADYIWIFIIYVTFHRFSHQMNNEHFFL